MIFQKNAVSPTDFPLRSSLTYSRSGLVHGQLLGTFLYRTPNCRAIHLGGISYIATRDVPIRARHCCRAMRLVNLHVARLVTDVSIRARHCCRAMPQPFRNGSRSPSVSIRARHCCRAMQRNRRTRDRYRRVSIRARHCCRAMPKQL